MTRSYFITGGTGLIGRELVSLLVTQNHEVTVLTHKKENRGSLEDLGVGVVVGDITDVETYKQGMLQASHVIHLAAHVHVGVQTKKTKEKLEKTNVRGTEVLLATLSTNPPDQVVVTSSRQVFGRTDGVGTEKSPHKGFKQSFYAWTKEATHQIARNAIQGGLPVTIAIPGTVYSQTVSDSGVGQFLRRYCQKMPARVTPHVHNTYADVRDVAKGIVRMTELTKAIGEEYILANGYLPYQELYDLCEELTGIPQPKITIPSKVGRALVQLTDPIARVFGAKPTLSKETLRNITTDCRLSNLKAQQDLGMRFRPLQGSLRESFSSQLVSLRSAGILKDSSGAKANSITSASTKRPRLSKY